MRSPGRAVLTSNLDIVVADIRQRDQDRYLSVLYAAEADRAALFALHGLDLEMASIVVGTTEPMIGRIRMAWWREALVGLDSGVVPAQPLLQLIADELLPRGIAGSELAELENRWLEMIESAAVPPSHVEGGGQLFAFAAHIVGGDPGLGARLGKAWVNGTIPGPTPVPPALRPLLGLVKLAVRDADRARAGIGTETRGSLGRQWTLLKAIALGR